MIKTVYRRSTGEVLRILTLLPNDTLDTLGDDEAVVDGRVSSDFYIGANETPIKRENSPGPFYTWDWGTKTWVPQLAAAKERVIALAVLEYRRQKELPIVYDAKMLDSDDEAREQLVFSAFEFAERARLSQPGTAASRVWENKDGTFYKFDTDAQFRNWLGGFVIALGNRTAAQRKILRQHVLNIRACVSVADVLSYDYTTGWPA